MAPVRLLCRLVVAVGPLLAMVGCHRCSGPEAEKLATAEPRCILHEGRYRPFECSSDEKLFGAWDTIIPEDDGGAIGSILGMQTVHAVMLPSGKILLVSGSSWRNLWNGNNSVQYYPEVSQPTRPSGCFAPNTDPFQVGKLSSYYEIVNNAAIYDPEKNTFYRIPHPVPVSDPYRPEHFAPNDLFCTGHQHLPDGNVLFAGGTQYYAPFRTGNRSTYIFDWQKEITIDWANVDWRQIPDAKNDPWIFSGFMERGRWYPSLVPLLDGRLVLFSGFVDLDETASADKVMYQFEINHLVEFFDPSRFTRNAPQAAWKSFDVKKVKSSPFAIAINPTFRPTDGVNSCTDRCKEANRFDSFKLYPVNYLMPDGRIFLTGEGDWVSLRTCDTAFMRRTKHTYWATIGGTATSPTVSFAPGPQRAAEVTSYGTAFLDPNDGDIHILGGQPTSAGSFLPVDSVKPNRFAGGRGSRKRETFHPLSSALGGVWKPVERDFLGSQPQDDRTMQYAIILPTRQVLVINGGNFDFYGPVHYPLLLTPRFRKGDAAKGESGKVFLEYERRRMAEAVEPRLYHNVAVLLPDGRVFISGGNAARATIHPAISVPSAVDGRQPKPNLDLIENDVYFWDDGPMAKNPKGMLATPTENWTAEIFSPPYMFIDRNRSPQSPYPQTDRQAKITSMRPAVSDYSYSELIGGRKYFLLRSDSEYDLQLDALPSSCSPAWRCSDGAVCSDGSVCADGTVCSDGMASLVLIKLPSATHGWESGERFVELPFKELDGRPDQIRFRTPDAKNASVPPGYYMMYYVDCKGKPSVARMVRFDDNASAP